MVKRISVVVIACMSILLFSGCWNYRGLDRISIVTGFAIDKNDSNDMYLLTCEIIDMSKSSKQSGIKTKIIESEGETVFEAIRNAKKRNYNKLYFSSAQIMLISHQIVAEDGLNSIIDFFIRDPEVRDNLMIAISQEKTASELLSQAVPSNIVVGYDINRIITEDNTVVGSTVSETLYEIYTDLQSEGSEILIAAVHLVDNSEEKLIEANGASVFSSDRLVNFLPAEDTKFLLIINGDLLGGTLTYDLTKDENITFEIKNTSTKRSCKQENGEVKIIIKPTFSVVLGEMSVYEDLLDKDVISKFEEDMRVQINQELERVIKLIQNEYGVDAFKFGNLIYRSNYKLWKEIREDWPEMFKTVAVEVDTKFRIINSAYVYK